MEATDYFTTDEWLETGEIDRVLFLIFLMQGYTEMSDNEHLVFLVEKYIASTRRYLKQYIKCFPYEINMHDAIRVHERFMDKFDCVKLEDIIQETQTTTELLFLHAKQKIDESSK